MVDRGVIHGYAAFPQLLLEITIVDAISAVPPHRPKDDLAFKMTTIENEITNSARVQPMIAPLVANRPKQPSVRMGETTLGLSLVTVGRSWSPNRRTAA